MLSKDPLCVSALRPGPSNLRLNRAVQAIGLSPGLFLKLYRGQEGGRRGKKRAGESGRDEEVRALKVVVKISSVLHGQ